MLFRILLLQWSTLRKRYRVTPGERRSETFISDDMLDQLPAPAQLGKTRVGGIDMNKSRTPTLENYDARRAAYDLKKLRAKSLLGKVADSHRYFIPPDAIRSIGALVTIREKLLRPILAGVGKPRQGRKPKKLEPY